MEHYAEVVLRCAAQLDRERLGGATIDPYAEMCQLTLRIVGGTLFGADLDGEADEALHAADEFFEQCNLNRMRLAYVMSKLGLRYSGGRKMRDARRRLDATIYRMIDRRRALPPGNDLLSVLVHSVDEDGDGEGMSDRQLRDEVVTFLLAGYETTASVLSFAWAALAQNPILDKNLHRELEAVLGGRTPALEDLPRLGLARRIFLEAMRLYPPAWIFGRTAHEPVSLGGYELPAGSLVLASPYVTHRRDDYFPQPDKFDPDRWLPKRQATLPEFAYFPFGGGVRRCIGEPLAMIEGPLILATLAQRWRLKLASPPPRETTKTLFLRPDASLRMQLISRSSTATQTACALETTIADGSGA
jgi:cytochrome P450